MKCGYVDRPGDVPVSTGKTDNDDITYLEFDSIYHCFCGKCYLNIGNISSLDKKEPKKDK